MAQTVVMGYDRALEPVNWEGQSHQQLYDGVHDQNDPASGSNQGDAWVQIGNALAELNGHLADAVNATLSGWQGDGGDAARSAVLGLAQWGGQSAQAVHLADVDQPTSSDHLVGRPGAELAPGTKQGCARSVEPETRSPTSETMVRFGNDGEALMTTQPQTNAQLAYSLGAVTAGLQQMQAGLASGELKMEGDAGRALSAALETAATKTSNLLRQVSTISSPAQLGQNAVSTSMAGKFVGRATGDGTALAPMLKQYQDILGQAKSAVDTAVTNFLATDESISSDLTGK